MLFNQNWLKDKREALLAMLRHRKEEEFRRGVLQAFRACDVITYDEHQFLLSQIGGDVFVFPDKVFPGKGVRGD